MIQTTNKCTIHPKSWVRTTPAWSDLAAIKTVELTEYRVAIKIQGSACAYWVDVVKAESFERVFECKEVLEQIIRSGREINMLDISVVEWVPWNEFIRGCN